jgi:hypothetical protein
VNVSTRQATIGGAVVAVLGLAALLLWRAQRRQDEAGPDWTDPHQPPDDMGPAMQAPDPGVSWAANRCGPMSSCCTGQGAGRRTRRYYAPTLADDPGSIVRAGVHLSLEGGL